MWTLAATTAEKSSELTFTLDAVLSPYIWVFVAAFIVTFCTTPLMRMLALKNGIVDWPDLKRKNHVEPVAYLGGVALFLGWFAAVALCYAITPHSAAVKPVDSIQFPVSILIGASIITLVGLVDDVYGISPRVKVGGQLLAAALLAGEQVGTNFAAGLIIAICSLIGVSPTDLPGFESIAYWLGAVIVAAFVLGGCNATNLLDGLDGLASGVTAIVALGFLAISVTLAMGHYSTFGAYSPIYYDPVRIVMGLALLGAVLGFLPYNFNPANIFMGDAGSLLLGYLCITSILLFGEDPPGSVEAQPQLVLAGLIVFAVPVIDTSLAIVRRKMRGQPIFAPDNQHLHHQLIRSGLTVKQSVLTLYGMAFAFAVIGTSMVFLRLRYTAAIFMVIFGFVVVMAYKVGHRQYLALQAEKAAAAGKAKPAEPAEPPQPMPSPETTSDDPEATTETAESEPAGTLGSAPS
jgi:UDP-GlcNAc:undecaprenyl-phosphate GlcNAc-1-phosphate transferase